MDMNLVAIARKSVAIMTLLWSPHPRVTPASPQMLSLPLLGDLELTILQQHELYRLRGNLQARLAEMLQPEQIQRFVSTLFQTRNLGRAIAAMQLLEAQSQYLMSMLTVSQQQLQQILTPAQYLTLEHCIHEHWVFLLPMEAENTVLPALGQQGSLAALKKV